MNHCAGPAREPEPAIATTDLVKQGPGAGARQQGAASLDWRIHLAARAAGQSTASSADSTNDQDRQRSALRPLSTAPVSRRNLLASRAQTPSLPVVMERGESPRVLQRELSRRCMTCTWAARLGRQGSLTPAAQDWQEWLAYQKQPGRQQCRCSGHKSSFVRAF